MHQLLGAAPHSSMLTTTTQPSGMTLRQTRSLPPLPASGLPSVLSTLIHLLIQYGFGNQLLQASVLFFESLQAFNFWYIHTAKFFTRCVEGGVGDGMFTAKFTSRNPGLGCAGILMSCSSENAYSWDVFTLLMKTLLTSECVNQRGAGQPCINFSIASPVLDNVPGD